MGIRGTAGRPAKPARKLWPDANNKTTHYRVGEASLRFDNKSRNVFWQVPENNHAVEYAHQNPIAIALFQALDSIKWTRGTGGKIYGNDEYNREACDDKENGDISSYVTRSYPPSASGFPLRRYSNYLR